MNEQFKAHYDAVLQDKKLQKPDSLRRNLLLVLGAGAAFAVFFILIMGFTMFLINQETQTPEYELCHSYLLSSDTYRQLEEAPSKVICNSCRTYTGSGPCSGDFSRTKEFGFLTDTRNTFTVVCHLLDNHWQVCRECTGF